MTWIPERAEPEAPQRVSEARAFAEQANMILFGQRPAAALPLLRRALKLDPREPLALEAMGTHYFLRNERDQARHWLSQSLDADPQRSSAAVYLALLTDSAADRERYLQSAVRAKPELTVAWQRLWQIYIDDGRSEQARRWCNRLVALLQPWLWIEQPVRCGIGERA